MVRLFSMDEFFVTAFTMLGLVALAELGDRTQRVCMTLAARHPPLPVPSGALLAGRAVLRRLSLPLSHRIGRALFPSLAVLAGGRPLAVLAD